MAAGSEEVSWKTRHMSWVLNRRDLGSVGGWARVGESVQATGFLASPGHVAKERAPRCCSPLYLRPREALLINHCALSR